MSKETTTVESVDMDLNDILSIDDSIMLPADGKKKEETPAPSLFKRDNADLSFLNEPIKNEEEESSEDGKLEKQKIVDPSEIKDILDIKPEDTDDSEKKNTGRPKMDKQSLVELTQKLIEKKMLVPFDDDKPISDYTLQDFEELFEANEEQKKVNLSKSVTDQFFSQLPEEFKIAHDYLAKGGNAKDLYRAFSQVEETRSLDPAELEDAKEISRAYLQATNFGSQEEIEEQLTEWEDLGHLENKASKFKPKLEQLFEQQVNYKLQQQEALRYEQQKKAQMYMESVHGVLEPGELNGIKIDRRTQNLLFEGLTRPAYQSVSGKQTNLLGHLLEKYQYVEPNHGLIAEALWLLADPDGYKNKIKEVTKKEVTGQTVRQLKTEEKNKIASHVQEEEKDGRGPRIPRPSGGNFFKRG